MVSEENPVSTVERSAELNELKKAIEKLPPQQKEVISLRFISGLSIAETAEIIGKTDGNVKKLQHVALTKLKKIMNSR
jgi:RNA polymerase sigma-70 factor (ECF subfamily)